MVCYAVHDKSVSLTVVQPGLTVHCTAEVDRADGVRIDEVTGQDDAVLKVDDEPVAVMGLLVQGVERERDVPVLYARVLSGDDGVVQAADIVAGLGVFLPYQPLGYVQTLQLLVDRCPVRHLKTPAASAVGAGIEQPGQAGVIHLIRWRQIQLQYLGAAEQLMHAADTQLVAAADTAY